MKEHTYICYDGVDGFVEHFETREQALSHLKNSITNGLDDGEWYEGIENSFVAEITDSVYQKEVDAPEEYARDGITKFIEMKIREQHIDREEISTPIQNALYDTGRFTTEQCDQLSEGILQYLTDAGYIPVRTINIKDIKKIAYDMQEAYETTRTWREAIEHVKNKNKDADIQTLLAMWQAIDACVDKKL